MFGQNLLISPSDSKQETADSFFNIGVMLATLFKLNESNGLQQTNDVNTADEEPLDMVIERENAAIMIVMAGIRRPSHLSGFFNFPRMIDDTKLLASIIAKQETDEKTVSESSEKSSSSMCLTKLNESKPRKSPKENKHHKEKTKLSEEKQREQRLRDIDRLLAPVVLKNQEARHFRASAAGIYSTSSKKKPVHNHRSRKTKIDLTPDEFVRKHMASKY